MSGTNKYGFSTLLDTLEKCENKAPIMLASSIQATLIGRYGESDYGRSKLAGEELFFSYAEENGAKVAVYRFPNLMGHSRPNYNSAVSTFCNAVANPNEKYCYVHRQYAQPSYTYSMQAIDLIVGEVKKDSKNIV